MSDKIQIDPKEFAYHFIDTLNFPEDKTNNLEQSAKKRLAAYLSAYYLIDSFNKLESSNFNDDHRDIHSLSYSDFLEKVTHMNYLNDKMRND
ncbi:hypothetical protein LB941_09055 [Ligilactobacillus sp. WILCCON 0076]|uniref:Uncharacterized protein n=1 Tax=Ligilactobacillus ubinensis TaxID=2876789 RepID=A0A9X2FLL2_9LACO|nr:hypothetical protein [Ligilactobacillus ubinensis]MCP0887484.1 hypothetical protein [Ligilactobacillus ubinensis]